MITYKHYKNYDVCHYNDTEEIKSKNDTLL